MMEFAKLQALGNDFVVVEARSVPVAARLDEFAKAVCDRHYGVGADEPGAAYFALHSERDHEHAAEARAQLDGQEDKRLVSLAESALAGNWALLDGVS